MPTFLALVGMFISVMLIGIILLQRGRGGGLVGALSGLGGQSAFGTKAGDTFTRITIGIAAAWVLLAGVHGQVLRARTEKFKGETAATERSSSLKEKDKGGAATKSNDSKEESGLGSSSAAPKDKDEKEGDSKSATKSGESAKEITPEDDKKSDSALKSKETPKKELNESTDAKSDDKSGDKK